MSKPPQAESTRSPKASSIHRLSPRNLRSRITVEVHHRGGSESWWELKARGVTVRRPGYLSLDDVLRELYGQ